MKSRRVNVFFYGLFMDSDVLRAKGVQPINPRQVCVPGFALRIGQRATLVPDPDASVYGLLMELTQDEIELLYAEPSVQMYRPEAVMAEQDNNSRIPALCFNLTEPPGSNEANEEYAQRLRDLARSLNLPPAYVDGIR